jgi:hypothetical protein
MLGVLQVKDGSWVMRQAVGSTPVVIGTKLATSYHRGANYLEVTVDISSNSTAASITNFVAGAVSTLSIWLGFVLEGKVVEHLPERLLGALQEMFFNTVMEWLLVYCAVDQHCRVSNSFDGPHTCSRPFAARQRDIVQSDFAPFFPVRFRDCRNRVS